MLQYINNRRKRLQTFVANRVAVIHEATSSDQWRKASSEDNPADDASRGLSAQKMVSEGRWMEGPPFLWKKESSWPSAPSEIPEVQDDDKEVKRLAKSCAVADEEKGDSFDVLKRRYSCWYRLKKAVAWILRFDVCLTEDYLKKPLGPGNDRQCLAEEFKSPK